MVIPRVTFIAKLSGAVLLASAATAFGGPPFMTDDPEPIEYQHSEAYAFSIYDKGPDRSKQIQLPAFEYNTSPVEDIHLHLMVPVTNLYPAGNAVDQHGLGDTELGIKYRFVHETDSHPQIGIFPLLELPTGNSGKGLGNGQAWWTLPVWIQKSWGDWTTYGGGGRAFNHAAGMRNYNFVGWLVQRRITSSLIIGGEVFSQGAASVSSSHATFFNLGGYYNDIGLCGGCSLLFRVGHNISGETHSNGYLGLYWSWGPASSVNRNGSQSDDSNARDSENDS